MSACVRCTALHFLWRLRALVRRKGLPLLSELTDRRGRGFYAAKWALEEVGYYSSPVRDTPKCRRKCIDAAFKALWKSLLNGDQI